MNLHLEGANDCGKKMDKVYCTIFGRLLVSKWIYSWLCISVIRYCTWRHQTNSLAHHLLRCRGREGWAVVRAQRTAQQGGCSQCSRDDGDLRRIQPTKMEVSWNRGTPKSSISRWDFPWNKPSSYWGTPVTMETPKSRRWLVWPTKKRDNTVVAAASMLTGATQRGGTESPAVGCTITMLSGWWFGTFFIFPYIGNNHPNWLIFFRGVQTTN